MKRTFFVFAVLSVFLSGCGLNSAELKSKNEALEIEKAGVLVVVDRVFFPNGGCNLILEGVNNSQKRWLVTFYRNIDRWWEVCIGLVSKDKVKATFVDIEIEGIITEKRSNTGDWLSMELIFE